MLSEKKKRVLVLAAVLCALVIDTITELAAPELAMAAGRVSARLHRITYLLFVSGMLFAIGLSVAVLVGTLYWKPGSRPLRVVVVFLSVVSLVWTSLWLFGLYFITHLNP